MQRDRDGKPVGLKMRHRLQLAAVAPAAIALAVWLYELAFVSRNTVSVSRIRYPAKSDHRR